MVIHWSAQTMVATTCRIIASPQTPSGKTSNDLLFSAQSQQEKRKELVEFLDTNFEQSLRESFQTSLWQRFVTRIKPFGKQSREIEYWQDRYSDAGRSREFESKYDLYIRKRESISLQNVDALFDNNERSLALLPQINSIKRSF